MTTPMNAYAKVANRFGVDPMDDDAIDAFFLRVVPLMPDAEREEILEELLSAIGTSSGPATQFTGELPVHIPLLPLEPPVSLTESSGVSIDDHETGMLAELFLSIGNDPQLRMYARQLLLVPDGSEHAHAAALGITLAEVRNLRRRLAQRIRDWEATG